MKRILSDIEICRARIDYLKKELSHQRNNPVMSIDTTDKMNACQNDQIKRYEEILDSLNSQMQLLKRESGVDTNPLPGNTFGSPL